MRFFTMDGTDGHARAQAALPVVCEQEEAAVEAEAFARGGAGEHHVQDLVDVKRAQDRLGDQQLEGEIAGREDDLVQVFLNAWGRRYLAVGHAMADRFGGVWPQTRVRSTQDVIF
jgi:hypothetical protein